MRDGGRGDAWDLGKKKGGVWGSQFSRRVRERWCVEKESREEGKYVGFMKRDR
ncbi:hypothetical protein TIFTF001_018445 [Ficus carica]|uniref:Uncharacterized protein n=1 Tax=Ficus carica TaxID=3494 RepID=A0AA88ARY3_FICCA|nr:hypothetical protein TIFTF001_018445 [Ficus carica]